jgi:hypothetical protein
VKFAALALLLGASAVIVFASGRGLGWFPLAGLAAVLALTVVGVRGAGRVPFFAALGIAVVDAVLFAVLVS